MKVLPVPVASVSRMRDCPSAMASVSELPDLLEALEDSDD
jgi:hypothetical protein